MGPHLQYNILTMNRPAVLLVLLESWRDGVFLIFWSGNCTSKSVVLVYEWICCFSIWVGLEMNLLQRMLDALTLSLKDRYVCLYHTVDQLQLSSSSCSLWCYSTSSPTCLIVVTTCNKIMWQSGREDISSDICTVVVCHQYLYSNCIVNVTSDDKKLCLRAWNIDMRHPPHFIYRYR